MGRASARPRVHRAQARGHIKTASYAQVVEPIYKRSAGRWQNYRKHLEPVLPVLRHGWSSSAIALSDGRGLISLRGRPRCRDGRLRARHRLLKQAAEQGRTIRTVAGDGRDAADGGIRARRSTRSIARSRSSRSTSPRC